MAEHVDSDRVEGELFTEEGPVPLRSHYVRFVDQVMRHPERWLVPAVGGRWDTGIARAARGIEAELPETPSLICRHRIVGVVRDMVHALADREDRDERPGPVVVPELPLALYVSDLIDALVGQLRARVSPETRTELERFLAKSA